MVQACIRDGDPADSPGLHVPPLFRRVCRVWLAGIARIPAGNPRPPRWNGQKISRSLGEAACQRRLCDPNKLGSQAFRRGASRAIAVAGEFSRQADGALLRAGVAWIEAARGPTQRPPLRPKHPRTQLRKNLGGAVCPVLFVRTTGVTTNELSTIKARQAWTPMVDAIR